VESPTLQATACSGGCRMLGARPPALPHPLFPGLRCKPPYDQLLIGVAGHRVVAPSSPVVVFPFFATGFSHVPLLDPLPPPLGHTQQPSSLRTVARSRGVRCRGHRRLPLVPVIVLSCVGGAGAGAVGVGVGVVIVISSPPFPPPSSCSSSSWRW
jgi:hypothetical protein